MSKKKKNKKRAVGSDLWVDDTFAFSCMGGKEEIVLLLSQELWQPNKKDVRELRSMHVIETHAWGTDVRLPIEAARQLYHALGCVLDEP